jgi:hypothetical protein
MNLKGDKSPLQFAVMQLALWPCVLGGSVQNNSNDWIQTVRKLQVGQFMDVCTDVFMNDAGIRHNNYLMSDFASDLSDLCGRFSTQSVECPNSGFRGLKPNFQNAFFRHATQQTGIPMSSFPLFSLKAMGDTGYIVSDKTRIELDVMKNDLCQELHTAFGGKHYKLIVTT